MADGKLTKEPAEYVDHPVDGKQCSGCSMFVPLHACTLVMGYIAPRGHCKHWEKRKWGSILIR